MPRKKKSPPVKEEIQAGPVTVDKEARENADGRWASEVQSRAVQWLWYPWFPRGMLSLIVGTPCVGKSTFIAALIAHTTGAHSLEQRVSTFPARVVLLPGHEEDVEVMTLPRLRKAGVILDRVRLVEQPNIGLVKDKERLANMVKEFDAKLLIGDPIDSYVDEGMQENSGQDVRPLLESAAWIAKKTGAAVVFARHPGKDDGNVMPGSRMWRAVPRSIVQLTSNGAIPPRFLLSHYKDSLGTNSVPRHYALLGDGIDPPRFALEEEVDRSAEELAKSAGGPCGRFKLMAACRMIHWMFSQDKEPARQKLGEEGRKQGLGEDLINEAMRLLGVKSVPPSEVGMPWKCVCTVQHWPEWLTGPLTPGDTRT